MPPEPPARRPSGPAPVPSLVYPSTRGIAIHPLREGATTIGRASDNDLSVVNPTVAEHHAVVIRDGEKLLVRDLLSGRTFVNDVAAKSSELKPGDVLRLGEVRMRVAYSAPSVPGSAPPERTGSSGPQRSLHAATPDPDTATPGSARLAAGETQRFRDTRRSSRALAHARQLSDEVLTEEDLEHLLARVATGFLEVFEAERGVCLLLEEDGRNPLLTVERRKAGSEEGTGVAREIIERSLQARTVVRIPPPGGDKRAPGGGFAAPLISGGKALGLLFFERGDQAAPYDADDVHLMAIIANQVSLAVARLLASG